MKLLVVAHPDDECLWFAAEQYDRIVIVHQGRKDNELQGGFRATALRNHPLRDRIVSLGLTESNYWRDKSQGADHEKNYANLCAYLRGMTDATEVTTHDARGEYGHADHIMVHNACMESFDCPVNGKDPAMFRAIRKAYKDAGCWTWE